jgi:hypothetical protein
MKATRDWSMLMRECRRGDGAASPTRQPAYRAAGRMTATSASPALTLRL